MELRELNIDKSKVLSAKESYNDIWNYSYKEYLLDDGRTVHIPVRAPGLKAMLFTEEHGLADEFHIVNFVSPDGKGFECRFNSMLVRESVLLEECETLKGEILRLNSAVEVLQQKLRIISGIAGA